MKQIDVQIMGQGYLLTCPTEGEERLLRAVERVDAAMCRIRDAGKVKARDRIAVLASLNLAFELCQQEDEATAAQAAAASAAAAAAPPPVSEPANEQTASGTPQDDNWQNLVQKLDHALGNSTTTG